MDICKAKLMDTESGFSRRVSLTRKGDPANGNNEAVIGWEYCRPQQGERYAVYLQDEKVLRTSPVVNLKECLSGIEIETVNSTYHIEYLD